MLDICNIANAVRNLTFAFFDLVCSVLSSVLRTGLLMVRSSLPGKFVFMSWKLVITTSSVLKSHFGWSKMGKIFLTLLTKYLNKECASYVFLLFFLCFYSTF